MHSENRSSRFPSSPRVSSTPHNHSETQLPQGAREAKGIVRKASCVCSVFPCCWKISKDISGADETFQHIHLESAVSLPSCIIYHTMSSCLKGCCKLFSESSFPLCAASCNNLSEIYFRSGVLQQKVVLFAFSNCSMADIESWFVIVKLLTRTELQMLCPDSLSLLNSPLWGRDVEAQNDKCKAMPINLLLGSCS